MHGGDVHGACRRGCGPGPAADRQEHADGHPSASVGVFTGEVTVAGAAVTLERHRRRARPERLAGRSLPSTRITVNTT